MLMFSSWWCYAHDNDALITASVAGDGAGYLLHASSGGAARTGRSGGDRIQLPSTMCARSVLGLQIFIDRHGLSAVRVSKVVERVPRLGSSPMPYR